MLALFPLFCGPRTQVPQLVLSALSLAACASSIAAFIVGAYLSAAAISGFKPTGEQTGLGPAVSAAPRRVPRAGRNTDYMRRYGCPSSPQRSPRSSR